MKKLLLLSVSVGFLFLNSGCAHWHKRGDCCDNKAKAECQMKGEECKMNSGTCAMKDGKCEHGKQCTLKDGKCDGCPDCAQTPAKQ